MMIALVLPFQVALYEVRTGGIVVVVDTGRVDSLRVDPLGRDLPGGERSVVGDDLMVHGVNVLPGHRVTTGDRDGLRNETSGLDAYGLARGEARERKAGTRKGTRRSSYRKSLLHVGVSP